MKKIATLMSAGALALTAVIANPGTAQALPYDCYAYVTTDLAAHASCRSGTGYYRVGMGCASVWTLGYGYTHYSNWVKVGDWKEIKLNCPFGSWNWKPANYNHYPAMLEKRDRI
ncbi:MAG: hypothetical protein Q4A37_01035 [Candidatus Saccharibacteria bacterium]|nr:hypothetical protein [Candidatus Saccharibacteria bacterium]